MRYTIGIDVGTTGVKVVLTDETGKAVASVVEEYPISIPKPNWSEQAPEDWWEKTVVALRKVLNPPSSPFSKGGIQRGPEIKGLSLSGQMHGLVLLDRDGKVLRPAILWNDQRCQQECEEIKDIIGRERLVKLTYNTALTGFTAPKIIWVRKNEPSVYEKAKKFLLPKDYIRYRLTGEYATEVSDASGTLLLDVKGRKWSKEIIKELDILEEILPRCYESIEQTGVVTKAVAEATGLPAGLPVYGGGGDQAAQAVGSGIVRDGLTSCTIGTSGVVFTCSDKPKFDKKARLHSFCHAVRGKWHVMGVMLSAGGSFKWLRELVNSFSTLKGGLQSLDGVLPSGREITYDDLIKSAEKSNAGANGLLFLPYLTGERTPYPDPYARGVFFGLSASSTKADMVRSVLEGITFGLKDSLELIKEIGIYVHQIRLSGGGAKSPVWRKIITDIFGIETAMTTVTEGAAFGASLIAGVGCGIFESVESACDTAIQITEKLSPDTHNKEIYEKYYSLYRELYPALKEKYVELFRLTSPLP